jgi:hypothetical protein
MRKLAMMLALGAALVAPSASSGAKPKKAVAAVPAPPPGLGQIVFYRSLGTGQLLKCRVSEEGEVVNRLPQGKYFVHPTTPGSHEYEIRSDLLRVDVKAGETQYVRCMISGLGVPKLSLKDRVDFDRQVRALDLLPPWTGGKDEDD